MRVLYVSTEVHPALKTGGLADVNGALPQALRAQGLDVRLLLPAFPSILRGATGVAPVASVDSPQAGRVRVSRGDLGGVPAYLLEAGDLYAREGNPYVGPDGRDWPDNPRRFALLGWAAARFADGSFESWRPDIVHAHDWHAGLAPAWLAARGGDRPGVVFTVHNLAFQGAFPAERFSELGLPPTFFSMHGVEFYGRVNFMKAGLHFADRITTVSPTYAREIQTAAFGCGMDGVLRSRAAVVSGILNGVDRAHWNPARDVHLARPYSAARLSGKGACRDALCTEMGLAPGPGPIFGLVSRLTGQKGVDLVVDALARLEAVGGRLVVLGAGDAALEAALRAAANARPGRVAVRFGFDEALAHRLIAGSDVVLVPSRFEPCGLTQLYALAYGSLPLVRRVGGLADTVRGGETGFTFDADSVADFEAALDRVRVAWGDRPAWGRMQRAAMAEDFAWEQAASRYAALYRDLRPAP